jgi:hypothetical protein
MDRAEADEGAAVSLNRYAKRVDTSQSDIRDALHDVGWKTWVIGRPCDLLCWKRGKGFRCLEVKTAYGKRDPKPVTDQRQREQIEFLKLTDTPVVCSPFEALLALGETQELYP